jgi:hypothetical protein
MTATAPAWRYAGRMPGTMRLRAVANGDVQGVGFRFAVRRVARDLGLTGFAENRTDGSLLVEAEGPPPRWTAGVSRQRVNFEVSSPDRLLCVAA